MRKTAVRQRKRRGRRTDRKKQLRRRIAGMCLTGLTAAGLLLFGIMGKREATPAMLLDKGYPQDLVELLERNPETTQFVLNYPEHQGMADRIDLSGEVRSGEIPLFLQWDERWGYEIYGSSFLAVTGCGPTCLSMVYCGLTGDAEWNPYRMASMAEEQGYYVDGVGTAWALMEKGAEQLGIVSYPVAVEETEIEDYLNLGMPVICSMGPGDFTSSGHFIVLKEIRENGEIEIADPNSRKNSERTWSLKKLVGQMDGAWAFGYDA